MKRFLLVFCLASILMAFFFHQEMSPNPFSRLLPVFGIVDHFTYSADEWTDLAYDRAEVKGHTYGEKAPLSSIAILPFYAVYRLTHPGALVGARREETVRAATHIGDLVAGAFPFAVIAALFFVRLRKEAGFGDGKAVATAWLCVFGSFLFVYGGTNFGHSIAAACMLGAYVLAVEQERHFAVAGFLAGAAVLGEYPLLLLQFPILCFLATRTDGRRKVLSYIVGAIPPALAMLGNNFAITGNPIDFPYNHLPSYFPKVLWRAPQPDVIYELMFGQYRGAAFYAPALFLFIPLLISSSLPASRKRLLLVMAILPLALFSAYIPWHGGWCTGPRYLTTITAILLYEGAGQLAVRRTHFAVFSVLSCIGVAINLMAVATNPCPNEQLLRPVPMVYLPSLLNGRTADGILVDLGYPRGTYQAELWVGLFVVFLGALVWLAHRWLPRTPVAR